VSAPHRRLDEARAVVVAAADKGESQVTDVRAEHRHGIRPAGGLACGPGRTHVPRDRIANHGAKFLISHQS
jgi:hypothetical protein